MEKTLFLEKIKNSTYTFIKKEAENKSILYADDIACNISYYDDDMYLEVKGKIIEFDKLEDMLNYTVYDNVKVIDLIENEKRLVKYHIRQTLI